MSDIRKQFKKDFDEASKKDLSFDTSKLEANSFKTRHNIKLSRVVGITAIAILSVLLVGVSAPIIFAIASNQLESPIKTKETIKIPARKAVSFKAGAALKKAIN